MGQVPTDLVFDARSAFSAGGGQLKTSCKKREMKFEFRLLNDILAKSVTVKAGSFDAVTHERFLLMRAIHCGLKINWSKLLFDILKEMVTPSSKQARGFAVHICVLLQGVPDLGLGEPKPFPHLKVLTAKTVGTYVAKNKNITVEEVVDEPVEKAMKKTAPKRRPAPSTTEPVAKKKRTTVGRVAPTENNLAIVTVAQDVEPISVIPAASPKVQRRRAPKCKLMLQKESDDETVDNINQQVIKETSVEEIEGTDVFQGVINEEELLVETDKVNEKETEMAKETETKKEKEIESVSTDKEKEIIEQTNDSEDADPLSKIPDDMMMPSVTAAEPTKITFGLGIQIKGVKEYDWYKASLPQINIADKGKASLGEMESSSQDPQPLTIKEDPAVVEVGANLQGKEVVDLTEEEVLV
ncbi:hypothetical protein F511_39827 [Dorcoceras hygrometricum]|uniref:Splicing factor 3B subunit 1-like n=1 Tax=Dorcoceras hygrometricum TaxID=472368 RepID=A0A2Z7CPG8_9LAMI|nr:hypothetical protein F511_39827 [Dorcoceras hygrometricum]